RNPVRHGPAHAARKAQPRGVLLADRCRAAAGFMRKIRHVQRACALGTASLSGLGGQLGINLGEQAEKAGSCRTLAYTDGVSWCGTRSLPRGVLTDQKPRRGSPAQPYLGDQAPPPTRFPA